MGLIKQMKAGDGCRWCLICSELDPLPPLGDHHSTISNAIGVYPKVEVSSTLIKKQKKVSSTFVLVFD